LPPEVLELEKHNVSKDYIEHIMSFMG
jgi:hypothetical protein